MFWILISYAKLSPRHTIHIFGDICWIRENWYWNCFRFPFIINFLSTSICVHSFASFKIDLSSTRFSSDKMSFALTHSYVTVWHDTAERPPTDAYPRCIVTLLFIFFFSRHPSLDVLHMRYALIHARWVFWMQKFKFNRRIFCSAGSHVDQINEIKTKFCVDVYWHVNGVQAIYVKCPFAFGKCCFL